MPNPKGTFLKRRAPERGKSAVDAEILFFVI